MNEQRKTPTPAEDAAIADMITSYFLAFLDEGKHKPGAITDDPEAQPLIAALQRVCPEAGNGGLLVKLLLTFAGGVDAGIKIAQQIGEGAQA